LLTNLYLYFETDGVYINLDGYLFLILEVFQRLTFINAFICLKCLKLFFPFYLSFKMILYNMFQPTDFITSKNIFQIQSEIPRVQQKLRSRSYPLKQLLSLCNVYIYTYRCTHTCMYKYYLSLKVTSKILWL